MSETTPIDPFIVTKEYKRFVEFCDACKHYQYIGLCYGKPGVGKTLSARYYAHWNTVEALNNIRHSGTMELQLDVLTYDTVFYTVQIASTPLKLDRQIDSCRNYLNFLLDDMRSLRDNGPQTFRFHENMQDATKLLLIDEADRLKMAGLEQIRDVYDHGGIGLILIGMPGIEKRLARYPQLYSRVGFVHHFQPLSVDELRFIVGQKWQQLGLQFDPTDFTDTEALNLITQTTSGNFRLLQRLFTQIERVLVINELHHISKEVVETARSRLVIGTTN